MRFNVSRTLGVILLGFLVAAPLSAQDSTSAKTAVADKGKWTGIIGALSIRGAVDIRVEPKGDKESRVRLSVRAAPINRQLAWDVVAGSCGDEGRPVVAPAAFRMLLTSNDGSGQAMANVPRLQSGSRYYVRVYAQGEAPSDRGGFGCANLSEEQ